MEDKSVLFEGIISKLKLNGFYDDINVNFYLTEKGIRHLAGSTNFANLRLLRALDVFMGDPGFQAIAVSKNLAQLESLMINGNSIAKKGIDSLI